MGVPYLGPVCLAALDYHPRSLQEIIHHNAAVPLARESLARRVGVRSGGVFPVSPAYGWLDGWLAQVCWHATLSTFLCERTGKT